MTKPLAYSLQIEPHPDDGGYLAYFPALPGCQTWGETYESAVLNAEEALSLYIETLVQNGDALPEETDMARPMSLGILVRSHSIAA